MRLPRPALLPLAAIAAFAACDAVFDPHDPAAGFVDVSLGIGHTCALRGDGVLFCWGDNTFGQLGVEGAAGAEPVRVGEADDRFLQVDAGHFHTCALRWTDRGGEPWCWGLNAHGQLGDDSQLDRATPVRVRTGELFAEVRAGGAHTCGITAGRDLMCWGRNREGQLGNGGLLPADRPQRLAGLAVWEHVDAGAAHTCAVDRHGAGFCWGSYYFPYTQFRTEDPVTRPTPVVGDRAWRRIEAGYAHTCGVTADERAFCLGFNQDGQIGTGRARHRELVDTLTEAAVDGVEWRHLTVGFNHTCGLTHAGALYCWGDNSLAQLGDSTHTDRPLPRRVLPAERWRAVAAGDVHTCGITASGRVVCWGSDIAGQLGPHAIVIDGPAADAIAPLRGVTR